MSKLSTAVQTRLFPALEPSAVFEHPLNERMRNLLRLEHQFDVIRESLDRGEVWDARNALVNMIELSDQLSRIDIKGELVKEIERYTSTLNNLRTNPAVNQRTLESTIARLEPMLILLRSSACQPGAKLRQSELVTQFKQRLAIPGATCSFDVPGLHYWLRRDPLQRDIQLKEWLKDMRIVEEALRTVLHLIRESTLPTHEIAPNGLFQQQLDQHTPCQMVRVTVDYSDELYPEISGNKHRVAVRFFRQPNPDVRPQPVDSTVRFELHCCSL